MSSINKAKQELEQAFGGRYRAILRGYIGAMEVLRCEWAYEDSPTCLEISEKDKRRSRWCEACYAGNTFRYLFPDD